MREKLTTQRVESIKAGAKRTDYWDAALPGFGLRVTQNGAKSWTVLYRHSVRVRRYTLGGYPAISLADARDAARKILKSVALGDDPATAKQVTRSAGTFGELFETYFEDYAKPKKRTAAADRQKYDRNLKQWAHRPATSITHADIRELLRAIKNRGAPIQANRVQALISKMFAYGIREEIGGLETNPARDITRNDENRRGRRLNDDEIRTLWSALDTEPDDFRDATRLALLTGQRKQEVFGALWTEIDFDQASWIIAAGRVKNKSDHLVPLASSAIDILRKRRASANGHAAVFPSPLKPGAAKSTIWRQMKHLRTKISDFWFHDLRRTAASRMTGLGIPRLTVGKVLNHTDRDVTGQHYDLYDYAKEKRAALHAWDRELARIVTGRAEPEKVVAIRG